MLAMLPTKLTDSTLLKQKRELRPQLGIQASRLGFDNATQATYQKHNTCLPHVLEKSTAGL